MADFYNLSTKETIVKLRTNIKQGLSAREVEKRQKRHGRNVLTIKSTPLWHKILEPFADLFMMILIIALVLSVIQKSWTEVVIIALDILLDAATFYIQRFSTERILRNLNKQTIQEVMVLRSGEKVGLDASELVPGDIVFLGEGDRIPADGRILSESGLLSNESMLTGESESIAKDSKSISGTKKIYERRNMVFSGSFVVTGSATMVVTATGNNTEYGRIASLASETSFSSPIQEKINKLVVRIAVTILVLAVIIFIIQISDGIGFVESTKFTLAMIVSAVPEDLPIVTAVILALGARRLAKKNALIKELRAIQSIGIISTIASDKTGTLTKNRLEIQKLWSPKNDDILEHVAKSALVLEDSADPLDSAIWEYVSIHRPHLADLHPVKTYAFDQGLKMSGNLFEEKSGTLNLVVKGAPEVILARCHTISKNIREQAEANILELSREGYKVIAIAKTHLSREINELNRLGKNDNFTLVGLVGVADAVRPEAKDAIAQANRAGVYVKMVTGDHAETAFAIGKKLGLAKDFSEVLDCSKLGNITDEDLAIKARTTTIFARVTPEDKYRILAVMKQEEVVAMTGDGVNDVPALTNAHVGIAMGGSPSIVRDAGDMVLLDNNFSTIIDAIKEGRVVLSNIRRMLIYLLSTNAGEVLISIGALLIGKVQILLPIQILWINMVTDSLMVIPLGLEPPERHFMHQKPEAKDAPILSKLLIARMCLMSLTMTIVVLGVYFLSATMLTHDESTTLAFIALAAIQWSNAFCVRGIYESAFKRLRVKNQLFFLSLVVAISLQILVLFTPLSSFIGTVSVPPVALLITLIISFIAPIIVTELHKKIHKSKL